MVTHTPQFLEDSRRYMFGPEQLLDTYRRAGVGETARGLDIGSGLGFFTSAMTRVCESSAHWVGIDRDERVISAARTRDNHCRQPIDYLLAQGQALPFADSTFDMSACHFLLSRLDEGIASAVLREMCRVTRPEGRLMIFEPCLGMASAHLAGSPAAGRTLEQIRRAKTDVEYETRRIDEDFILRLPGVLRHLGYQIVFCELLAAAWWSVLPRPEIRRDPELIGWLERRARAFAEPNAQDTLQQFGRQEGAAGPLRHGFADSDPAISEAYRRLSLDTADFDEVRKHRARTAAEEMECMGNPDELSLEVIPVICMVGRYTGQHRVASD